MQLAEFPLHYAVDQGDKKKVRELIDFGVNMNDCNSFGETPLIIAARRNHKEIFDLLIQYGAQVNCGRDRDGWTALHWACFRGLVDQVQLILEKGVVDLNAAANDGDTPLMIAARREHKEIYDLLIQYGAQVNCGGDRDGWTALHWSCSRGLVDQVQLILEKGVVDLNAVANDGDTPLMIAARREHKEIYDLLIQYGAQVKSGGNRDGWTTLHWASSRGWLDVVRHILEK